MRRVHLVDKTAPILTLGGTNPTTIKQGGAYTDVGATSDGGEAVSVSGAVLPSIFGVCTITFTATDANGNDGR
jgi:hypothetical protein